jgi:signal recognition particle subunit SEC65
MMRVDKVQQVHKTSLARALQELKLSYDFTEYSAEEKRHWQRKHQIAEEMKAEFDAEGQEWLYHRRWKAEYHRLHVEHNHVVRYVLSCLAFMDFQSQ